MNLPGTLTFDYPTANALAAFITAQMRENLGADVAGVPEGPRAVARDDETTQGYAPQ